MKSLILALALVGTAVADQNSGVKQQVKIECRGVIEEFVRGGMETFSIDGECELLDITWVIVKTPEPFVGIRHMLLSRSADGKSPFGKVGDEISFTAFRSTLESEQPSQKKLKPRADPAASANSGAAHRSGTS